MLGHQNYKIVRVGDVEPIPWIPAPGPKVVDTKQMWWNKKFARTYGSGASNHSILAYHENSEAHSQHSASFFSTFLRAYNSHKDLVLAPDDVWMMIGLQFSAYANKHSSKLRSQLVAHEEVKKLTVTTLNDLQEDEWHEFMTLILEEIRANTKPGVVDALQSDFTTTGDVERLLSTAVVMDTLKKFFRYGRCIPSCGIRNAAFLGTLEDWRRVLEKLQGLRKYAVTAEWAAYVDNLAPVLEQFICTYSGQVDRGFWDKVMDLEHGRLGSGSTMYVSGWVLAFYGKYGSKVEVVDISDPYIDVPVLIDNRLTCVRKLSHIVGGFGGVSEVLCPALASSAATPEGAEDPRLQPDVLGYKPQLSFVICTDGIDLNK